MADINLLRDRVKNGLEALQLLQAEYDAIGWRISDPAFEKFRHIALHLTIMAGRFSAVCEAGEHEATASPEGTSTVNLLKFEETVKVEVADMLFHAAQLANLVNLTLHSCLMERYATNASRFAPDSKFASII